MVLLKILLPVLFLSFTFAELLRIQLPGAVSMGIIDVVILGIVFVWLILSKKGKYKLKIPILLFISAAILSQVVNVGNYEVEQIKVGLLYLVRWILYAALYFVFVDIGRKFQKPVRNYMILSGVLILIFGFIQYKFYPSLKNLYYLGWDDHLYRIFSTFLDPNFAGVFIVLFIIFIFFQKFKKSYIKFVILTGSFAALILTYSRGAILMLLVSTFIYSLLKKNYKLIGGLIGVLVLITIALSPNFHTVNTDLFRMPSLTQRIENINQTLYVYSQNPDFGVGFNNFRYARDRYVQKDWVDYPSHAGAGSDNSFALILATTGIPGILAYLYLLYKILRLGLNNIKKTPYAWILVLSLVGLIANSFLLNSLFYSFIMIWIWVIIGLTESSSHRE